MDFLLPWLELGFDHSLLLEVALRGRPRQRQHFYMRRPSPLRVCKLGLYFRRRLGRREFQLLKLRWPGWSRLELHTVGWRWADQHSLRGFRLESRCRHFFEGRPKLDLQHWPYPLQGQHSYRSRWELLSDRARCTCD